jgi:hypothetical protein
VTIQNGQTSADGGGLLNDGGLLFLHFSVLRDNRAPADLGDGGGLAAVGSGITRIDQSTIGPGNLSATRGGGVYVANSSLLYLRDSTLSGNTTGTGGGLYVVTNSTVELDHTTVVLNTASANGGGLVVAGSSQLSLGRSLVSGNTSPGQANCLASGATLTSLGYNLLGPNGSAGGCPTVATDQLHAGGLSAVLDPQLRPDPARGVLVHMPLGNSPALDAIPLGQACATASYDARNVARPLDAGDNGSLGCDIGAVEGQAWLLALPLLVR